MKPSMVVAVNGEVEMSPGVVVVGEQLDPPAALAVECPVADFVGVGGKVRPLENSSLIPRGPEGAHQGRAEGQRFHGAKVSGQAP